ncbi:uncharacterized protein STEHIDRAFT_170004 [Stereum hirsutum FP-91666 SS1]|uniref:uncharacterized protein n=1 Tax=Stereum hirsutum (strain FP-91666) TaxID=721885 RepID=UPI0004449292|nr:uncharacterized protein STEHIDRAFT_170004 [Stereum hirsutum FP-91666 SS1]EIM84263.1 hypothetical protein STEHIDRAFT_170004 [Stereum hirsutum FP-91666 SS1]
MGYTPDDNVLHSTLTDAVRLVPAIIVESALFGVLSLVVLFSTTTLLQQSIAIRPRIFMMAATLVMYLASATHWILNCYTLMREIRGPEAWAALPVETVFRWSLITTIALFFSFWISDIVVMWRACVLWVWNRYVLGTAVVFSVVPLILATIDAATSHPTTAHNTFQPNIFGLLALLLSLLSNIWATSLIGYKAWRHRKDIKSHLGSGGTAASAVRSIMALLVESGFLYCITWALFIISTALLNKGKTATVAHIIAGTVPQLVGLYPAVIIVLVSLQKSHTERNFTQQNIEIRPRIFMLAATLVMYLASATHWSLNCYTLLRQIREPEAWAALPSETVFRWSLITTIALFFSFWISDMVVMWRACVLWVWNRYIFGTAVVFSIVPLILAIIDAATSHPTAAQLTFQPSIFGLLALLLSLLSNIWATSLIGYRAWCHRKDIRSHLGNEGTPASSVQSIMALLVESGFLYCITWAFFILNTALLIKGKTANVAHVISGAVPQLVGIYPAVIIVLVSLRKSHTERNFTYESPEESIIFAAAPRTQGSMATSSHHVRTIQDQRSAPSLPPDPPIEDALEQ